LATLGPEETNLRGHIPSQAYFDFKRGEAMEAATAGLPEVLLKPQSKVPYRKGWQDEATTDRRTLGRRLRSHPECNVGIATGRGIAVIDVDGIAGEESYAELTRRYGLLPRTATCMTGRGGWHLYFKVEPGVLVPNRVGLWPGIDGRGDGGYVVAPGSRHPNGDLYEWINRPSGGIAGMPAWLLKAILAGKASEAPAGRKELSTGRTGDLTAIVEDLALRFPVDGIGQRNDRMNRAIASLLGRGFEPNLILEAIDAWHERFRGIYRSDRATTRREAMACLESKRRSKNFSAAVGSVEDHASACRQIELSPEIRRQIESTSADSVHNSPYTGRETGRGEKRKNAKRVTQSNGVRKRLCESGDELAFVEAILVHVIHKVKRGEFRPEDDSSRVLMTHDQLRQIVSDRHGGPAWDNTQFERLKAKYVGRPGDGKPATRAELLREVVKGRKEPGGPPGVPSEYLATGITRFLPRPDPPRAAGLHHDELDPS
jgi:hypothetical protein